MRHIVNLPSLSLLVEHASGQGMEKALQSAIHEFLVTTYATTEEA